MILIGCLWNPASSSLTLDFYASCPTAPKFGCFSRRLWMFYARKIQALWQHLLEISVAEPGLPQPNIPPEAIQGRCWELTNALGQEGCLPCETGESSVGWQTSWPLLKLFGSPEAVLFTSGCVLPRGFFFFFLTVSDQEGCDLLAAKEHFYPQAAFAEQNDNLPSVCWSARRIAT